MVPPGGDLIHDRVSDRRDQIGRCLDAIDFFDMPLDIAAGHAAGIHADDLAAELWKAALIIGDRQRIDGAVAVARHIQNDLAAVGGHGSLAAPLAAIKWLVLALDRFLCAHLHQDACPSQGSARAPLTPCSFPP